MESNEGTGENEPAPQLDLFRRVQPGPQNSMNQQLSMEAFILAGGASSRMGREKALLELDGVPMAMRLANLLWPLVSQVTLVGPPQKFVDLPLRVQADDQAELGPLGGIATALRVSRADWNLVIGCDLPFLSREWLTHLIQRAQKCAGDAVLPLNESGQAEPLCAMYRTRARGAMVEALGRGVRKVTDGLAALRVEMIAAAEWKPFDSRGLLFKNMNAPEDYARAQEIFQRGTADLWLKGPGR